jgi:hypothetical protein
MKLKNRLSFLSPIWWLLEQNETFSKDIFFIVLIIQVQLTVFHTIIICYGFSKKKFQSDTLTVINRKTS